MEEVGRPRVGQEQNLGPHRRHLDHQGERFEGVGHHWGLPRKEGDVDDDTHAPALCDGAQGIV